MKVNNVCEIIGKTPILNATKYSMTLNPTKINVWAKLEYLNPTGSIKDRAALYMINEAEKSNTIKKGGTIIEPTSGNTGLGIASIAAQKGYKVILTMPETMSVERRNLLKAYGAEIVLTDGKKGMKGSIEKAEELKRTIANSIILGQFDNKANALAHKETTGPEIWNDLDGKIDFFIATVGTGGTLTGCAEYLKSKNRNIKVVAVEPYDSPVLSGGSSGSHKIQGIGAGFVPSIINMKLIDEVIKVKYEESIDEAKIFGKTEGALVGISSGAALAAIKQLDIRSDNADVVVMLPDSADRYMSTELFENN